MNGTKNLQNKGTDSIQSNKRIARPELAHINASLHLLAQGGKSFSQIPQKNLLILKKLFDCRDIEQIYRNKPTVVKCAPVIENTRKLFGLLERFNANKADGYAFGGAEAAYLIYPLTDEWALVVIIDGELPSRNALALRSFRERRVGAVKRKGEQLIAAVCGINGFESVFLANA